MASRADMSEKELAELKEAIETLKRGQLSTPEGAREFLRQVGLLDDNGQIAPEYR
jgi:hypothetical protein